MIDVSFGSAFLSSMIDVSFGSLFLSSMNLLSSWLLNQSFFCLKRKTESHPVQSNFLPVPNHFFDYFKSAVAFRIIFLTASKGVFVLLGRWPSANLRRWPSANIIKFC